MCESLYFNLLFRKLSDVNGEISVQTLTKLSNYYPGMTLSEILNMYESWKNNPQVWCLKSDLVSTPIIKVSASDGPAKTDDLKVVTEEVLPIEDVVMVIHVCDEPKNLKRDFHCQKYLLIGEMRYFADYLSSETQSAVDVDISVHCDVNIFEWLMKYVKRDQLAVNERVSVSSMKANNAISILISSDFLKMDKLVEECIDYIHMNLNAILASSFNINCVNASLLSRISDRFSDLDLDNVVDKKDKIKSGLYRKKIESLFDVSSSKKAFAMAPATSLFRCKFCQKILIKGLEQRIICIESRLCVSATGTIIYCHGNDESWTIHNQLSEWVREYRSNNKSVSDSTIMLYWRLWAYLNCVECETCGQVFPLFEIGHCRFHTDTPNFGKDDSKGVIPIVQGIYNCCGVMTLRFDPFHLNKGCKAKDHVLKLSNNGMKYTDEEAHLDKIVHVLANHRQLFEVQYESEECSRDFISGIMGRDNMITKGKLTDCIIKDDEDGEQRIDSFSDSLIRPRLQPLLRPCYKAGIAKRNVKSNPKNIEDNDEDIGDSEDIDHEDITDNVCENEESLITVKTGAILLDAPRFPVFDSKKWDNNKSMRYNQDSQRQEDLRRMRQMIGYLIGLRINIDKSPKQKAREVTGGIYCRLEQQWRSDIAEKSALVTANLMSQRSLSNLKIRQKQTSGMQPFK